MLSRVIPVCRCRGSLRCQWDTGPPSLRSQMDLSLPLSRDSVDAALQKNPSNRNSKQNRHTAGQQPRNRDPLVKNNTKTKEVKFRI